LIWPTARGRPATLFLIITPVALYLALSDR